VSENKRRYQKDGFDLDLTYVTGLVAIYFSQQKSGYLILLVCFFFFFDEIIINNIKIKQTKVIHH